MTMPLAALLAIASVIAMDAEAKAWIPQVDFQLETANKKETLHWVSGWAYAMTESGQRSWALDRSGSFAGQVCLGPGEVISSKFLLDALNSKFRGKTITSEQAAALLWETALFRFPCGRKS